MYTAIKTFCENGKTNGLFLMDMPTGFGKTYSVIKYIYDASMDEVNKDKKFFFVTTLKKNLPEKELKDWFEKAGQLDKFNEKYLFIDSNSDCIVEKFCEEIRKSIPQDIKKREEYVLFEQDVKFLQDASSNPIFKQIVPSVRDNLRLKTEPAFRKIVQGVLSKEFSTIEQRINAIKKDPKWQWVGKLYPAVFTREKQIIFMSIDKFLMRNTTLVEPSYMFYNSDIMNNAVIFIDEFDSTKERLLKNIIENGLRDKVDYIELFKDIYSAIHTNEFPTTLFEPSKQRLQGEYKDKPLTSVFEGIKEKADKIYEEYSLQFNHRTTSSAEEVNRNFLFQDHQFHSILDEKKHSYISVESDRIAKINAISFTKEKPKFDKNNIQKMLGKLRGFVKWFQGAIKILAINYRQLKLERRKNGEDEFTTESAIRSVLALFRLSSVNIEYLTTQIMVSSHKTKGGIQTSDYDISFYERGFRYYSFEDDANHDMQSKIMMCSFQTTPEKILLRFCERAKVIGISATATVPTAIGNYDLEYLSNKLQDLYTVLSDEDYNRLKESFDKTQFGYKDINISVELLGAAKKEYTIESWNSVFENEEIANSIFDYLEQRVPEDSTGKNKAFNKERYLRIALAYRRFLEQDDIQSFLCVLTKHPRIDDRYLNLGVLSHIFEKICKEIKPNENYKSTFCLLNGEDFDETKESISKRFAKGEKIFVISAYQTIGAGQNLQYEVPNGMFDKLVRINERNKKQKDFDAIYLDKPTNLLVPLQSNISSEDFVRYLFYTEFLQETGFLSPAETRTHVKKAFECFSSGHVPKMYSKSPYDSESVVLYATKVIIQAIGRICRTSLKRKNIYVFADDRIADSISLSIIKGRMLNQEFIKLIEKIETVAEKTPETKSLESVASLTSIKVNKEINNLLREDWDENRIKRWKELRNLVLKHPTISTEEIKGNFIAHQMYVELPRKNNVMYFTQDEDYNNIVVGFEKSGSLKQTLSFDTTRADILLSEPSIFNYFTKNGWATEFAKNDYIMSPPLWNNIYKGAIGEVVGKFLLEEYFGVFLQEISEENFELFDYKVANKSIFVDFKNWDKNTDFDEKEMQEKILLKAQKCGCDCVIIANMIEKKEWKARDYVIDGIRFIIIPNLVHDLSESLRTDGKKIGFNKYAYEKLVEVLRDDTYNE